MSGEGIETEQRGKILIITMNRPKVNAINHAMSRALYRAFDRLQNDRGLMVGILASANPRVFPPAGTSGMSPRETIVPTIISIRRRAMGPGVLPASSRIGSSTSR